MPRKSKKKATKKSAKKKAANKAANKKGNGRGKRYSDKQKASLLDKYHAARSSGMTAQQAAKKVGISYLTLLRWEKSLGKAPPKSAGKGRKAGKKGKTTRKKSAGKRKAGRKKTSKKKTGRKKAGRKPDRPAGKNELTLVTPTGYRVEGITTAELIRILKAAS